MSRFYATVNGQSKTTATKCGNKQSGMYAHIRGWNIGATIDLMVDSDNEDILCIEITGGSNNAATKKFIGRFKLGKRGGIIKLKN